LGKVFEALKKSEQSQQDGCAKPEEIFFINNEPSKKPVSDHQESDISELKSKNDFFDACDPLPIGINEALVTLLKPNSVASEQFRQLKSNIFFPEKGEPPRTIMITSPSPHEGKSFVAANLAISIAQSIDEFVFLVDCDLRRPSIHTLFGIDEALGLSDYLSSAMPLSSLLKKTFINKLTILPGGSIPQNPSELLSSEQMKHMLHEVKLRYSDRYILIDTPPPYISSETNAIARYVDGIILVVRHGKTRIKEIQDIVDIYGKDKILGVIQNFSKKWIGYGYGYHKYGYGKQ